MRKLSVSLATAALLVGATASRAADLDYGVLRGADEQVYVPAIDWNGVYVGGHGGWSTANLHVGKELQTFSSAALGGLLTPDYTPSVRTNETSFGGFAGYNLQLDDTVVGVEVDYTRSSLRGRAEDAFDSALGTVNRQTSTAIRDYGTVRARAGYVIGSFLPFATAGLAVARLEEVNSIGPVGNILGSSRTSERYTFGFTAGAGLDFALTDNIVLRGEYQYAQFDDFRRNGVDRTIEVSTFRGGAAVKF